MQKIEGGETVKNSFDQGKIVSFVSKNTSHRTLQNGQKGILTLKSLQHAKKIADKSMLMAYGNFMPNISVGFSKTNHTNNIYQFISVKPSLMNLPGLEDEKTKP